MPLRDNYLDGAAPWLAYDFIEGGTLAVAIRHWAKLPGPKRHQNVLLALQMLAKAVGRFHALEPPIVHRDLKPANILYDRNGKRLRITDFGIGGIAASAMLQSEKNGTMTMAGRLQSYLYGSYTPLYASPQQKAGAPPDPRDDVHAFGVIAYQMLTGQMNQGVGPDYADDLRELDVDGELIELIGRCTAQKVERRPVNAAEIAKALGKFTYTQSPFTDRVTAPADNADPLPAEEINLDEELRKQDAKLRKQDEKRRKQVESDRQKVIRADEIEPCWFCKVKKADAKPRCAVLRSPQSKRASVMVPRCTSCRKAQARLNISAWCMISMFLVLVLIMFLLPLAFDADSQGWFVAIGLMLGACLGLWIGIDSRSGNLYKAISEFPQIKEQLQAGWRLMALDQGLP